VMFDWIVGRNSLGQESDRVAIVRQLRDCLRDSGQIMLLERLPKQSQRLYQWLSDNQIDSKLYQRWQKAEEAIYAPETGDPLLNWDALLWQGLFADAEFEVRTETTETVQELYVTPKLLERWFTTNQQQPSYGDRLRQTLSQKDVDKVRKAMQQYLERQTVRWQTTNLFLVVQPKA
jgi:putative ATPase